MDRALIPRITDPTSPWYALSNLRTPNVKWCENQLNSWIIEPANTWSNLAFVIVGLILWSQSSKFQSKALKAFGPFFVALGFCSGIYHASYTFFFQVFDYFGMYLLTYLMLYINMQRAGWIKDALNPALYWGSVLGTTAITVLCDLYTKIPIQLIIFIHILLTLVLEMKIRTTTKDYSMKSFYTSSALITVAATFSVLDVTRVFCNPENHIVQGHALWHIFSTASMTVFFLHVKQFDAQLVVKKGSTSEGPGHFPADGQAQPSFR